ncbi:MAG: ATP-binding protein [Chloroflexota bacterium]
MGNALLIDDAEKLSDSLGQLPESVASPAFVVVSGLPGTGKSYFCRKLTEKFPFIILESDALRKALFSSPNYSAEESSRLFQAIHNLIERLLKKGISVILGATNLSERNREYLYSIAEHAGIKLIIVRVEAPPELVQARLSRRQEDKESKSEADWTVYQKMKPTVEKISHRHYVVDTSRDITPVLEKIAREIRRSSGG